MNKLISLLLAAILAAGCLAACGSGGAGVSADNDKLQIVTTIYPLYDWTSQVLGDDPAGAELTLLVDSGVDLHSYQPSAGDLLTISTCDLFIYVGGESDAWVEDALKEAANKEMVVLDLLDILGEGAREEEIVEGMEAEPEEHTDAAETAGTAEETASYDEHVWLSLRNAAALTEAIAEALETLDPDHADAYRANTDAYLAELASLDERYQAVVSEASVRTLLFGDRFPFLYLTEDYGLSYYAAFAGCSAETEASFETIAFLAQKVDELSLHCVLTIDGNDQRIAETIVQSTQTGDQKILTLDSLQSVSAEDIQNGTSYLSVMESNLEVLREALQ